MLAGLAALIVALSCIPVDANIVFSFERYGEQRATVRVKWLFGLVRAQLGPAKAKKASARTRERRRERGKWTMIKILRTRGLPRRLIRLLREVAGTLRVTEVTAHFRIGLDDPAATGGVFAVLGPALAFLSLPPRTSLRVEPWFGDQVIVEGYLRGEIGLRPIRIVPPLARFALSRPALRAARNLLLRRPSRR